MEKQTRNSLQHLTKYLSTDHISCNVFIGNIFSHPIELLVCKPQFNESSLEYSFSCFKIYYNIKNKVILFKVNIFKNIFRFFNLHSIIILTFLSETLSKFSTSVCSNTFHTISKIGRNALTLSHH